MRREALKVLQQYLICIFEQIVQKQKGEARVKVISEHLGVLKDITGWILPLMKDYFDSVREEACVACEYLIQNFVQAREDISPETSNLLRMIKA